MPARGSVDRGFKLRRVRVGGEAGARGRWPCLYVPAMSSSSSRPDDPPATVEQLAAAMAALGLYTGHNTPEEHAEEAERLSGRDVYRLRLANALLGGVQIEALLGETRGVTDEQRAAAHREQLLIAGVVEDPAKLRSSYGGKHFAWPDRCARSPRTTRWDRSRWRPRTRPRVCSGCSGYARPGKTSPPSTRYPASLTPPGRH